MANHCGDHRLIVFAKAPVAGQVKTRLQPELTPVQSVALHRALVEHTLRVACALEALTVELWVSDSHAWWGVLEQRYAVPVFKQCGDDLGERMARASADALERSASVMIIGTDCPFITGDYLMRAWRQLAHHPAVLGPAEDGGYVLIGLRSACAAVFANVDWGNNTVLQQTRTNLQRAAINWIELDTLADIDRAEDLPRLQALMPELLRGCNISI